MIPSWSYHNPILIQSWSYHDHIMILCDLTLTTLILTYPILILSRSHLDPIMIHSRPHLMILRWPCFDPNIFHLDPKHNPIMINLDPIISHLILADPANLWRTLPFLSVLVFWPAIQWCTLLDLQRAMLEKPDKDNSFLKRLPHTGPGQD